MHVEQPECACGMQECMPRVFGRGPEPVEDMLGTVDECMGTQSVLQSLVYARHVFQCAFLSGNRSIRRRI